MARDSPQRRERRDKLKQRISKFSTQECKRTLNENQKPHSSRERWINLIVTILLLAIPLPIKVRIFTEMTVTEWMLISGILYLIWVSFRKNKDLITIVLLLLLKKHLQR